MILSDHKGTLPAVSLHSNKVGHIGKLTSSVSLRLNILELKTNYKICYKFIQPDQNDSSFFNM